MEPLTYDIHKISNVVMKKNSSAQQLKILFIFPTDILLDT